MRPASAVLQAGATTMPGLVGDTDIPRVATGAAAAWVATEGGAVQEQTPSMDNISLRPRDVGAFVDFTRRLILQGTPGVETLVRNDLRRAIAVAIDFGAIQGSGASGQPTGVLNTSGIGAADAGANSGALTWDNVTRNVENVTSGNAARGNLGWITNGAVIGHGMRTVRVAGQPKYILDDENTEVIDNTVRQLLGTFPVFSSENIPSDLTKGTGTALSALIFGAWQDLIIGEWGTLDVLVDPFTASSSGTIRIRVIQTIDIAVRYAASFSATDDIDTT